MRCCSIKNKCPNKSRCINHECGNKEACIKCANFIDISKRFCLHHGLTEFYKNGKCKLCVKYQRMETFYKNQEKKNGLEKTLHV